MREKTEGKNPKSIRGKLLPVIHTSRPIKQSTVTREDGSEESTCACGRANSYCTASTGCN